jgi:hypothetical protein
MVAKVRFALERFWGGLCAFSPCLRLWVFFGWLVGWIGLYEWVRVDYSGGIVVSYYKSPHHPIQSSKPPNFQTQDVETRQGMYKEYTVEKTGTNYENAEGTFKTKGTCERAW